MNNQFIAQSSACQQFIDFCASLGVKITDIDPINGGYYFALRYTAEIDFKKLVPAIVNGDAFDHCDFNPKLQDDEKLTIVQPILTRIEDGRINMTFNSKQFNENHASYYYGQPLAVAATTTEPLLPILQGKLAETVQYVNWVVNRLLCSLHPVLTKEYEEATELLLRRATAWQETLTDEQRDFVAILGKRNNPGPGRA